MLLTFVVSAQVTDLPSPPSGYTWIRCDETKSAFLKPDGWYFKKKGQEGGTWGYFFSKEDISKSHSFVTGLSVNVVPNVPATTRMPVTTYAAALIGRAMEGHKVVQEPWQRKQGPFESFSVQILNKDPEKGDFITNHLAIANPQTGTLYVLIFEAPVESWDAAWKLGETMLKKFVIDTNI